MREEFLHFVWKNSLFESDSLIATDGSVIEIVDTGTYNRDSGPDFFNARIRTDDAIWAGNVEIHLKSSHWYSHGHHKDKAYNNVILHVVGEDNSDTFNEAGMKVLTVTLRFKSSVFDKYTEYLGAPGIIGCSADLWKLSPFIVRNWISGCAVERLEEKGGRIRPVLHELNNDWEETLYRFIAAYFGHNVNSEPFYRLASSLPLSLIRKHSDNLLQIEALLFGQAGMLEEGMFSEGAGDEYCKLLKREYKVLRVKYALKPLHGFIWKFHRMRPSSFPTVRISQVASLLCRNSALFASVIEAESADTLLTLLYSEESYYWKEHYAFGKKFPGKKNISSGRVGRKTGLAQLNLVLNAAVPITWVYGRENSLEKYCRKALMFSEMLPPERNRVTREWEAAGVVPLSALDSQGLITIRDNYCRRRRCLNCHIGSKLIAMGIDSDPGGKMILEEGKS
ncbi:MAG: DUF2851 family protein [Bacteroidales bacterium]|nr:DUF2851 family protein [Bacteroidales bacterium]